MIFRDIVIYESIHEKKDISWYPPTYQHIKVSMKRYRSIHWYSDTNPYTSSMVTSRSQRTLGDIPSLMEICLLHLLDFGQRSEESRRRRRRTRTSKDELLQPSASKSRNLSQEFLTNCSFQTGKTNSDLKESSSCCSPPCLFICWCALQWYIEWTLRPWFIK